MDFRSIKQNHLISWGKNLYTPQTNIEPENTPLEKDKLLKTTNFLGFHISFRGKTTTLFVSLFPSSSHAPSGSDKLISSHFKAIYGCIFIHDTPPPSPLEDAEVLVGNKWDFANLGKIWTFKYIPPWLSYICTPHTPPHRISCRG